MKVYNTYKKFTAIIMLSSLSLIVLGTSLFVQKQKNISSTQAASNTPAKCSCTDPNYCYPDGCSGKVITSDNRFDDGRYKKACSSIDFGWPPDIEVQKYFCSIKQPDSCFDVYTYKDDRLACFIERWFCHPSLCEGSSGKGDCGKYWRLPDGWTSYGCVKGPDNDHLSPIWENLPPNLPNGQAQQPTATPIPPTQPPTNPPTAVPTSKPNEPTYTPAPTSAQNNPTPTASALRPTIIPTQSNAPAIILTPTSTPIKFQAPNVKFDYPKEIAKRVINPENISFLNSKTEKALKLPSDIFDSIIALDNQLENYANGIVQLSINKFNEFLGQ